MKTIITDKNKLPGGWLFGRFVDAIEIVGGKLHKYEETEDSRKLYIIIPEWLKVNPSKYNSLLWGFEEATVKNNFVCRLLIKVDHNQTEAPQP